MTSRRRLPPDGALPPRHWGLASEVAAGVIVVVALAGILLTGSSHSQEFAFLQAVSRVHVLALDWLALAINWLFGPPIATVVTVVTALLVLWRTRSLRRSLRFLTLIVLPWVGADLLKILVRRPRPEVTELAHHLVGAPASFSYPSGHTSFAASLGLAIVVLVWRHRLRRLAIIGAAIVAVATAASRVYLGVHYPTDVVAALLYTTAAVVIVDSLWRRLTTGRPRWR
ncbi:hypothetical protein BH09ACT1_BH09ACT1_07050 [soil metagenome]